ADRAAAAAWLTKRIGKQPAPGRVVITHGTQDALIMLLATLVGPGGTLIMEGFTYPSVKGLASLLGITIKGVAMDREGMLPDAFSALCRRPGPKALYCMPTVHNPTTVSLPMERRRSIIETARKYNVPIIEDDAYGLFADEELPPIASMAPDVS